MKLVLRLNGERQYSIEVIGRSAEEIASVVHQFHGSSLQELELLQKFDYRIRDCPELVLIMGGFTSIVLSIARTSDILS